MKITITPGQGPDAKDFAATLASAYVSRAARLGLCATTTDDGVEVDFDGSAFRHETGIHRLTGISAHDPEKRRVTSFVGVHVEGSELDRFASVRSYVTAPYTMATDYRLEIRTEDVDAFLAGDFSAFYG